MNNIIFALKKDFIFVIHPIREKDGSASKEHGAL